MKRRDFLGLSAGFAAGAAVFTGCAPTTTQQRGARTPAAPEEAPVLSDVFEHYDDSETGARIYVLTPGNHQDQTVYQTHPQWTPRMEYLVFNSDRGGNGMSPHALEMTTGRIRPLLEKPAETFAMGWNNGMLYYVHERAVYVMDVAAAFQGEADAHQLAMLPVEVASLEGGISADVGGRALYFGGVLEAGVEWCLAALDLREGGARLVAPLDFQIGNVQANPYVSGEVMFCHETGGDAPKRIWFVDDNADGAPRPFYETSFEEWVTHEVWWGSERAVFTIWPHDEAREALPHGVAWADKNEGALNILHRFRAWHTHGSPDGRWVMADDFDRNIWLLRVDTGERRLWTQGHQAEGMETHPNPSFTPDSQGLVFTSSQPGSDTIMLAELPQWTSLPA